MANTQAKVKLTKAQRNLLQKLVDGWKLKPRHHSRNYTCVSPDYERHSNIKAELVDELQNMGLLKLWWLTDAGRAVLGNEADHA
jgi:hypothetical protein